jgi:hypothetical protein
VKASLPVVQVDELGVRRIVADDHIEVAVAVEVHEPTGVRTIGRRAEVIARLEMTRTVAKQHAVDERPMAALHEDDVESTVSVDVTDADVRRGFGGLLEE